MYKKAFVIAEVGCNHMGNMKIAHNLIDIAAKYCGVDAIKFQKRCPKELLTEEQYNAPHPNPINSFGETYGEHREFLEFSIDKHRTLKKWCEDVGIIYSASVWDMTSAKEIASLEPKFIKIPSACNNHWGMLSWLCENYSGELQISLGMTNQEEEKKIINLFNEKGRIKDLILYSCTSGYPVRDSEVCLLEIMRLKEKYGHMVKAIGFSGHHLGTTIDIAAYTLGAEYIERHYTLDKTWKGTDHSASLEPDEMYKLNKSLESVKESLIYKNEEVLQVEQVQRNKLKYREK